jgi:hypothetical protein
VKGGGYLVFFRGPDALTAAARGRAFTLRPARA